jgi:hypothetical protein
MRRLFVLGFFMFLSMALGGPNPAPATAQTPSAAVVSAP